MRSTDGRYFPNLDHIRGCAAFLVFSWHFTHASISTTVNPSFFLLSVVDEGHCGVSLFMVLSGYLFTKLLYGRTIAISWFFYNRLLRLAPLLILALLIHGLIGFRHGQSLVSYLAQLPLGLITPTWPGGAWSITTELHFYALLPILLWLLRKWPTSLLLIVVAAILFRFGWWWTHGTVQALSYYTIIGRIDQFLFGMLASSYVDKLRGRHLIALSNLLVFAGIYYWFDVAGGFEKMPSYPSPSPVWVILPSFEAFCFAILVGYYDSSFAFKKSILSAMFALVGTVSYSIYLLHVFLITPLAEATRYIAGDVTSFDEALLAAIIAFPIAVAVAWVSYKTIEEPLLRFRLPYLRPSNQKVSRSSGNSSICAGKNPLT